MTDAEDTWADIDPAETWESRKSRVAGASDAVALSDEITLAAAGGDATAAGMTTVAPTDPVNMGYDEINKSRDYVAQYAKKNGPLIDIWVQSADPGHKAGRLWIKRA